MDVKRQEWKMRMNVHRGYNVIAMSRKKMMHKGTERKRIKSYMFELYVDECIHKECELLIYLLFFRRFCWCLQSQLIVFCLFSCCCCSYSFRESISFCPEKNSRCEEQTGWMQRFSNLPVSCGSLFFLRFVRHIIWTKHTKTTTAVECKKKLYFVSFTQLANATRSRKDTQKYTPQRIECAHGQQSVCIFSGISGLYFVAMQRCFCSKCVGIF